MTTTHTQEDLSARMKAGATAGASLRTRFGGFPMRAIDFPRMHGPRTRAAHERREAFLAANRRMRNA